jgi:hypothetical protein
MQYKITTSIILIMLLHSLNCKSQPSFTKIFESSKDKIAEIENLGYQVIHVDLDILSSDEKEETRISLNSGRRYVIVACSDQDRIKTVQIELYEESDNKKTLVQNGRDGIAPSGSSVIDFKPEKDNNYLISISAKEFNSGITSGRFYLIVASR